MFKVIIYTDGSCIPQDERKPGGYAAILKYGNHTRTISGAQFHTTSQQMELTALIEALKMLRRPCEAVVFTDSQYVMKCAVGEYKINKNAHLFHQLDKVIEAGGHKLNFIKVEAHTGIELNEECDELAKKTIAQMIKEAV